ncbi:hypothetical protein QJS66_12055 [Kocuria rhizophila]|nr:hypothetical protein QJS66_12055 [Kocuria rhizophila]
MLLIAHDLGLRRGARQRSWCSGRVVEQARRCQLLATSRHPYTQEPLDSAPSARPAHRGGPRRGRIRPARGAPQTAMQTALRQDS